MEDFVTLLVFAVIFHMVSLLVQMRMLIKMNAMKPLINLEMVVALQIAIVKGKECVKMVFAESLIQLAQQD